MRFTVWGFSAAEVLARVSMMRWVRWARTITTTTVSTTLAPYLIQRAFCDSYENVCLSAISVSRATSPCRSTMSEANNAGLVARDTLLPPIPLQHLHRHKQKHRGPRQEE